MAEPVADSDPTTAAAVAPMAPPTARRRWRRGHVTKLEPGWRARHRVRSGVVLTVAVLLLGLLLAAVVGLAISAAVVAVNHATASSTTAP
jgi:hypothetical protein